MFRKILRKSDNKQNLPISLAFVFLTMMAVSAGCGGGGGGGDDHGDQTQEPVTYTLSGSIRAPSGAEIDSDVNDPNADYASNDSPEEAQPISNPVTLGGYVNVAGTGADGRSYLTGDVSDYFSVTLTENQAITLYIADITDADLDLYLYDSSGENLMDASLGTDEFESLTVADGGDYIVQVFAYDSASNYALVIGQAISAAASPGFRLSDKFVSGQVVARFSNDKLTDREKTDKDALAEAFGMRAEAGAPAREMLLSFDAPEQREKIFQQLGFRGSESIRESFRAKEEETADKLDTLWIVKSLRHRSDVLFADPNYIRETFETPNDTYYTLQWHYSLINLPQAWDLTTGDSETVVAVVDTGVLLSHPDLQGQLTSGYDFISSTAISLDGDGIDSNPDDVGDQSPGGSSFHGTHVAGTVAAATNNGTGVAGVARSAKIMPLRALGKGGGTSYDILQAVRYAAGLENDSGTVPERTADIINLSLGGSSSSQSEQDVYTAAVNAGVIIVAAAGNSSTSTPSYPAAYAGVISVSAVDLNSEPAYYSNFGSTIDIAAPGGDTSADVNGDGYPDGVLSTAGEDSSGSAEFVYKFNQGTSMASPHMAGVAALMKAVYPGLTPAELDSLITSGSITKDLGSAGRDDAFGYGLIDAYDAVAAAQELAGGDLTIPATLVANPSSLNFDASTASAEVVAENGGGENLTVTGVTDDTTWLTVAASEVDDAGLGTYLVTVDRSGLSEGSYSATITFTSSENTVEVSVIMKVGDATQTGDTGHHYVLLLDSETLETLGQVEVEADQGVYAYVFDGVASGTYKLYAGTDSDNDFVVGDAGESVGAYPSLDEMTSVTVENDVSGLDFNTGLDVNIPTLSLFGTEPKNRLDQAKEIAR
jgi:serine protease